MNPYTAHREGLISKEERDARISDPMAYEYVKQAYGVTPEIGARVRHNEIDKHGVIVRRKTYDNYVYVKFDGEGFAKPCHPLALDYPQGGVDV